MANQLHYQFDYSPQDNSSQSFLSLAADQICLIDDCFDEMIEQTINQKIANDDTASS